MKAYLFIVILFLSSTLNALDRIHFLIPGGVGGGWDSTARGVGDVLARSQLVEHVSFENISGGGGGKALSHLIETARRQQNTLMVNSTPIIINSLKQIIPQTYNDITPVAAVIADYGAFVVKTQSPLQNWQQLMQQYLADPRNIKVAGGSSRGSMDHLVAALAISKSGGNIKQLRYIPYNAGARAMVGLLSGETQVLSTGLSEAIALAEQGEVRILAMTADKRLKHIPQVATLVEQQIPVEFINWRGFFAAPDINQKNVEQFQQVLRQMYSTEQWQQVRDRQGWSDLFISGAEFHQFLGQQQQDIQLIMRDLGML